jgi:hypothetical protein
MSINILKKSLLTNSLITASGFTQQLLTRGELKSLVGLATATGINISAGKFVCLDADLHREFYCTDYTLVTDSSSPSCSVDSYMQKQSGGDWSTLLLTRSGQNFLYNFTSVLPDQAQMISTIRTVFYNGTSSGVALYSMALVTSDSPIEYNYQYFSVVASSYANAPINITNNSIQGTAKDIRVVPVYTNNFEVDRALMLTASGKDDSDKYHINRGYCLPEQIPWSSGFMSGGTTVSGRYLTLSGSTTSGSWISPAIYMPDPNYITMYVYSENTSDQALLEKDWTTLNRMDARGSNETPLPNFLIVSQTKQFNTLAGAQAELPTVGRRPVDSPAMDSYDISDPFWQRGFSACDQGISGPSPFVYGNSQRIYLQGDGTVIAQNTPGYWDISERDYFTGAPFKLAGDINDYWNVSLYLGLLGGLKGACLLPGQWGWAGEWNNIMFTTSSPSTQDDWVKGRKTGGFGMPELPPFKFHFHPYNIGVVNEPVNFEFIGSTTIHMDRHPNEWAVVNAVMYPTTPGEDKYMCVYLLNTRNFWVSEKVLLGIYGIGQAPCDEGYAVCRCNDTGNGEGGIWVHAGYADNVLNKFSFDGSLLATYTVKRGYSFMKESGVGGLWMVRTDGIFYYQENIINGTMDVVFVVEHDDFQYLYAGDVDQAGNLWVVDRDTSTVYRINLTTRTVDYQNYIPYAMGVWPHPSDGSAFVYVGFNPSSFSTAIKRVWANDPYGYEELVTTVPSNPLSDLSGVQFMGKLSSSYISPGVNDPVWGTDDSITLDWEGYTNGGLSLPDGNYKQFIITLRRNNSNTMPPRLTKIRIPEPLILKQVPYQGSSPVHINPHLRYDIATGHFTSELLTWWPHG